MPDLREVAGPELLGASEPPGDRRLARWRCRVQQGGEQGPGPEQDHGRPGCALEDVVQGGAQVVIRGRQGQHDPDGSGVIGHLGHVQVA